MNRRALFIKVFLMSLLFVPTAYSQSNWHGQKEPLEKIRRETRRFRENKQRAKTARQRTLKARRNAALAKKGPLGRHIACYESIGQYTDLGRKWKDPWAHKIHEFTLVASTNKDKKGLYLCKADAASFNPVSSEPLTLREPMVEDYYFAFNKEGKKPLHIHYTFPLVKGKLIEAVFRPKISGVQRTSISTPKSVDAEARAGIETELARRIGLMYETYLAEYRRMANVLSVMRKEHPDAAIGGEEDFPNPEEFLASLEPCGKIKNKEIQDAVKQQRAYWQTKTAKE